MAPVIEQELALLGVTVRLRVSSASDRGNVRAINEDSFLASPPVFMVADGMGGHSMGDKASQTVVATFEALFAAQTATTTAAVIAAIEAANSAVGELTSDEGGPLSVAGTTLAGLALIAGDAGTSYHWMAINIGDSRVYSWDGSSLSQVTVDHSTVQELVDQGLITSAEAAVHPQRNVITRAVGVDDVVDADVWLNPVEGKQLYLMCSDGLTKEVDDETIAAVLREAHGNPAELLVEAALRAGGADNVTVVVVESDVIAGALSLRGSTTGTPALRESLEDTIPRQQRTR